MIQIGVRSGDAIHSKYPNGPSSMRTALAEITYESNVERSSMRITNCRSCGCDDLRVILDLGSQPIANALLSEEELDRPEARFTLQWHFARLARCCK